MAKLNHRKDVLPITEQSAILKCWTIDLALQISLIVYTYFTTHQLNNWILWIECLIAMIGIITVMQYPKHITAPTYQYITLILCGISILILGIVIGYLIH